MYLYLQTQFGEDRCPQFRVIVITGPEHRHAPTDRTDYNTLRRRNKNSVKTARITIAITFDRTNWLPYKPRSHDSILLVWITEQLASETKSKSSTARSEVSPVLDGGADLELIPVLNSRPAADQSHKPGGKLPLPSTMAAVTFLAAEHHRPLTSAKLYCLMHKGLNNLSRVVTQPRTDLEFNPRILRCKPDAPRVVSPRLTYCSPYCRMFSVVCSCSWQCN